MPSYVTRDIDHAMIQAAKLRARAENLRLDDLIRELIRVIASREQGQPLFPLCLSPRSVPGLDRPDTPKP